MSDAQLIETEAQHLCPLSGHLNWTSQQTRPDINYQTCEVSASIKNATIRDLKTISTYLCLKVVLKFPNLGNLEYVKIICFSDTYFGNLQSGSSQGGFIIFMWQW